MTTKSAFKMTFKSKPKQLPSQRPTQQPTKTNKSETLVRGREFFSYKYNATPLYSWGQVRKKLIHSWELENSLIPGGTLKTQALKYEISRRRQQTSQARALYF